MPKVRKVFSAHPKTSKSYVEKLGMAAHQSHFSAAQNFTPRLKVVSLSLSLAGLLNDLDGDPEPLEEDGDEQKQDDPQDDQHDEEGQPGVLVGQQGAGVVREGADREGAVIGGRGWSRLLPAQVVVPHVCVHASERGG